MLKLPVTAARSVATTKRNETVSFLYLGAGSAK
jgi:hypothetical protein